MSNNSRWSRRAALAAAACLMAVWRPAGSGAQQPAVDGERPPINAAINDFGLGPQGGGGVANGFVGAGNPLGGLGGGGAASADFDSLIDLITSTVQADSWQENGTGEGDIQPFPNGVWVDAAARLAVDQSRAGAASLAAVRARGAERRAASEELSRPAHAEADAARTASPLRYVSLPRLEAAIARRQAEHLPLDPAMLTLAGLERVQFVLAYPESGDLVLAGPAGDWRTESGAGLVSAASGAPLVRLDDLLALWRRQRNEKSAAFGCSIVPRQDALAATQQFLAASAAQPLDPSQRRQWLGQLRDTLGVQDVEYYNIDSNTRIAGLLLAADYHMKLVGMGLAEGVPGVRSYLSSVRLGPGGAAPPMSVLRWWFSLPKSNVVASAAGDAYEMPESCVEVLSENELLAARGQRVHTGQSEELNARFARAFTAEFAALGDKYPIYGQLARVFELSLALALVEQRGLTQQVGWSPSLLLDGQRLRLPQVSTPRAVETVINHRVIGGRQIIAGVSGGVWVNGAASLTVAPATGESAATLAAARHARPTPTLSPEAAAADSALVWWWD